jgi:RNA polymerase sigma-B factor
MPADRDRSSNLRRRLGDARLQRRQLGGDRRARAELVERYLPLAKSLAWRYRTGGEPIDDLVQVASLALQKALQRWDPDRGTTFSTFAVPTILGELRRHFRDRTWAVKPPRATQELAIAVIRTRERLSQQGSRAPGLAQIAATLQRTEEEVIEALMAAGAQHAEPLDQPPLDDDGRAGWLDRHGELEPGYARVVDASMLDGLIARLDPRARVVLHLAFAEGMVQREIAERIGCSQMQVSRIVRDALERLRLYAGVREEPAVAA